MAEYIEREALWRAFEYEPFYDNADRDEIVLPKIDDFPAADVEPVRHARWKAVSWWQHKNHYECNECSICGCRVKPKFTYNYCPNCGAKMDLEVE